METYAMHQTQMQGMPWHNGGLFMGMHWIWWSFWIVVLAALLLAFWRLYADSRQMHARSPGRSAPRRHSGAASRTGRSTRKSMPEG